MRRLIFALFAVTTISFSGCALKQMMKMASQQDLQVNPSPLEVHADTVKFEVSAVLPQKMLRKNYQYELDFKYQHNGQEVDVDNITFDATQYSSDEQPRKTETFSFPYSDNIGNGNLVVRGTGRNPANDKSRSTDEMAIAEGVVTTSRLVKDAVYTSYASEGYNPGEELEPVTVNFYFLQGRSDLRRSERTSDRGDSLEAFIAAKNVTRTVTITGTHSPEGPERVNERLSENRAKVIEDWYRSTMDRYDYQDAAKEISFILKPVVEDWGLFREYLADYAGISEAEKREYYNIIDGSGDFEQKEDQMQRLSTYRKVFREVYPELRRARTEILKVVEKKPEADIAVLAKQIAEGNVDPDTLTAAELDYGATLTPSLDEKERIYKALVQKSDSWVAHNNLGAVYLQKAMGAANQNEVNQLLEQAVTEFEISLNKKENAPAYTNLALVYSNQGNNQRAVEAVNKAEDLDPESDNLQGINAVKGVLQIKTAQYQQAIQTLSNAEETSDNLFNLGLAYLLNKDYQNAMTTFEEAIEANSENALAYYGRAIASARMNNASGVYENLRQAVRFEPEIREKALKDVVFQSYAGNDQFRQSLQ